MLCRKRLLGAFCLSRWFKEEAEKKGLKITDPDARQHIYGMPYSEWKEKYQK